MACALREISLPLYLKRRSRKRRAGHDPLKKEQGNETKRRKTKSRIAFLRAFPHFINLAVQGDRSWHSHPSRSLQSRQICRPIFDPSNRCDRAREVAIFQDLLRLQGHASG